MVALKIILTIVLGLIFYQDIKDRQVHWFLFPIFGFCAATLFYKNTLPELFFTYVGINAIIILIMSLSVWVYIKFKLKVKQSEAFGLGDLLLLVGLVFSFATISFLTIFVFALIFSLIVHQLVKHRSKDKTVPLAGYLSLFFVLTYISYWAGLTNSLYTF